jgi:hypothetical protein
MGIRLDLANLADGRFDAEIPRKAILIREDLALWNETIALGNGIWNELHLIAQEHWWPIAFWRALVRAPGPVSGQPPA